MANRMPVIPDMAPGAHLVQALIACLRAKPSACWTAARLEKDGSYMPTGTLSKSAGVTIRAKISYYYGAVTCRHSGSWKGRALNNG